MVVKEFLWANWERIAWAQAIQAYQEDGIQTQLIFRDPATVLSVIKMGAQPSISKQKAVEALLEG